MNESFAVALAAFKKRLADFLGVDESTATIIGDSRIETLDAPLCQKASRAGNLGPPCGAFAPYQVLVDMFVGCPHWFNACGKHAQLAVMSGRAFDWRPNDWRAGPWRTLGRLHLQRETLRSFTAGDGPDDRGVSS